MIPYSALALDLIQNVDVVSFYYSWKSLIDWDVPPHFHITCWCYRNIDRIINIVFWEVRKLWQMFSNTVLEYIDVSKVCTSSQEIFTRWQSLWKNSGIKRLDIENHCDEETISLQKNVIDLLKTIHDWQYNEKLRICFKLLDNRQALFKGLADTR